MNIFRTDFNYHTAKADGSLRFPDYCVEYANNLCVLYDKYHDELVSFTKKLVPIRQELKSTLNSCPGFCDIEAELLYILIRELKPAVTFEISSRHGFTTNFIAAALAKNGTGQLECFEITESFNGTPTEQIIRGNILEEARDVPLNVHIGDARIEATKQLERLSPNFLVLDSLHTDVFSEYYTRVLFPCIEAAVYIQDINHYGPRPEWASEAYYTLDHLLSRGTNFLSISLYEDHINNSKIREGITSHRVFRSSSIFFNITDRKNTVSDITGKFLSLFNSGKGKIEYFPVNSLDLKVASLSNLSEFPSEEDYFTVFYRGKVIRSEVTHAGLMASFLGRVIPDGNYLNLLVEAFDSADAFHRVLILHALANHGRQADAASLYDAHADACCTSGLDVNVILANTLFKCGKMDSCKALLETCLVNSNDVKLTGAPMQMFIAAALSSKAGWHQITAKLIGAAWEYIGYHKQGGVELKGDLRLSRVLYRTSFRRPHMLLAAFGSGFPKLGLFLGFIDFFRFDLLPKLLR